MGSAAYQNPTMLRSRGAGTVSDSYNVSHSYNVSDSYNVSASYNVSYNYEISMSDENRRILEWLSPLTPWERHRVVSGSRIDAVGDWLLGTNEFGKWHTGKDEVVHPVLFCYGDPGVGKTYLRCVK